VTDSPSAPEPIPPPHWEADVLAADGATVHLRPIRSSDADALVAFHAGLSTRTRYLRYFSAYPRIPDRDLYRFTHVDHHDRVALVVLLGAEIIAVGRYERAPATDEAEVAFVVADAHQGRGIGSVLLEHLAAAARECGVRRFTAIVLAENTAMIGVFRHAGYETTRHLDHGEVQFEFSVAETDTTAEVMREREQRAEARSVRRLLYPRSVAVVGASNDPGKVGHATFTNLLRTGFNGPLYPVNADARHVRGVPAYRSVLDVPGDLDLVVIAVPAPAVPEVVQQCAQRGVRGLVVLSGGFGERGPERERIAGRAALHDVVAAARANGMRVVGPNCLGVINTDPEAGLNASLAPLVPLRGRAGFFAQSGALGVAVLGEAARRGIGVSTFVSAGSRADVSGNDLLQYWETDETTDVVLMYLESFGNPRKFARLSRRLGRSKPIIAVNSAAGTVVAGLETTSSVVLPEATARALFERSGVIRVDTVGDLFDTAAAWLSRGCRRKLDCPGGAGEKCLRCRGIVPGARTRCRRRRSSRRVRSRSTRRVGRRQRRRAGGRVRPAVAARQCGRRGAGAASGRDRIGQAGRLDVPRFRGCARRAECGWSDVAGTGVCAVVHHTGARRPCVGTRGALRRMAATTARHRARVGAGRSRGRSLAHCRGPLRRREGPGPHRRGSRPTDRIGGAGALARGPTGLG
jgi:succinyl-CoA synthetase alpha subunit/RimJ/RimL family protein N-acetyltransferase